jgi:parvulin-like peptidyl-prolyl isomerase
MVRVLVALALVACSGAPGGPTMNNKIDDGTTLPPQRDPVESADILAREPVANTAQIKHILIGWNDSGNDGRQDQRAAKRTKKDAEDQVRALLAQIKSGADFDALMKQYSEDPGSASAARAYTVSPDAQLVLEFKELGLRLKIGEVGVVQSEYGFHIMKRVE